MTLKDKILFVFGFFFVITALPSVTATIFTFTVLGVVMTAAQPGAQTVFSATYRTGVCGMFENFSGKRFTPKFISYHLNVAAKVKTHQTRQFSTVHFL